MDTDKFKDHEYVCKQMLIARKAFGSKNTTRDQYDAMEKCLSLMFVHCPYDLSSRVYATLQEAVRRRVHFELHFWAKESIVV